MLASHLILNVSIDETLRRVHQQLTLSTHSNVNTQNECKQKRKNTCFTAMFSGVQEQQCGRLARRANAVS